MEIVCMKYQILSSKKNKKKYFKMSFAENFTQSAKQCMTTWKHAQMMEAYNIYRM